MGEEFVKSHIQMPRSVLKKFENSHHELYYYEVKTAAIKKGHAKSLNRKFGYYSKAVEGFLRDTVETPFGQILEFISETDFSLPIHIPLNAEDYIWRYIHALVARGPAATDMVKKNSVFFQFLSDVDQHDFAARDIYKLAQEKNPFSSYFITFMVNETSTPFVLPTGGMYMFDYMINCPVTPTKAITLVRKDVPIIRDLIENGIRNVLKVESTEHILTMNKRAFQEEMGRDRQYVVAPERKVLEETLKLII